jgi:hypothetical protein
MTKQSAIALMLIPFVMACQAAARANEQAMKGFYLTGAAGMNGPSPRYNTGSLGTFEEFSDPGFSAELGAGYDFGALRLEATYALDRSSLKGYVSVNDRYFSYSEGGSTTKQSAFLTSYWDIFPKQTWTPYLGAGVGYSNLNVKQFAEPGYAYDGYGRSLLGYQFKAGMSVNLNHKSTLFAEAVYRGTSGFQTNDGFNNWQNASFSSWGGQLGVRIGL